MSDEAERQLVGLCLRYPEAVEAASELGAEDFDDTHLGRLFLAARLIRDPPARPGPLPDVEPEQWATTPLPEEWAEWLAVARDWRPRQAARMAQTHPDVAVALHDGAPTLGALGATMEAVQREAKLRRYRLKLSTALNLAMSGADPEDIEAILATAS